MEQPQPREPAGAAEELADDVLVLMVDEPLTLQGVGEVVVESTRLEWQVAYTVAIALDQDEDWLARTLGRPGGALREVRALCAHVGEGSSFGVALAGAAQRAADLLEDRATLVHSVAMWNVEDPAAPTRVWWHPRSDTEHVPTVGEMCEHAHAVRACSARFLLLGHDAIKWRSDQP